MHFKKGMYFSFNFGWYPFQLDVAIKKKGGDRGWGLLNGQNLFSEKKVI